MPLKVSDGIGAWIDDFKKSDAPQFKGKSEKERRDQAIAAYLSAKRGDQNENSDAVKAFLAKGGKITKLPPGKAQGYHGKDDPGKDVKGVMAKPDTDRFSTRKKVKSMENYQVQQYKDGKKVGAPKSFGGNLKKATAHANKMGGDHRVHKEAKVDEVSSKTLGSYIQKASDASKHRGLPTRKVDNRYSGVAKAQDKLAKAGMMGTTAQRVSKAKVPASKNEDATTYLRKDSKLPNLKMSVKKPRKGKILNRKTGKFEGIKEETNFEVNIEGLPMMFMSGMGPGEIKQKLRKIVKQPSMIQSVKRVTDATVRKTFRLKAQGRDEEENEE